METKPKKNGASTSPKTNKNNVLNKKMVMDKVYIPLLCRQAEVSRLESYVENRTVFLNAMIGGMFLSMIEEDFRRDIGTLYALTDRELSAVATYAPKVEAEGLRFADGVKSLHETLNKALPEIIAEQSAKGSVWLPLNGLTVPQWLERLQPALDAIADYLSALERFFRRLEKGGLL